MSIPLWLRTEASQTELLCPASRTELGPPELGSDPSLGGGVLRGLFLYSAVSGGSSEDLVSSHLPTSTDSAVWEDPPFSPPTPLSLGALCGSAAKVGLASVGLLSHRGICVFQWLAAELASPAG